MKKLYFLSIIISSMLLGGCASITNGVNESVSVNTPPTQGATCKLANSKGKWYVNNTPGSVVVHRDYDSLNVTCKKNGYAAASKTIRSHTKGMAFGNVVFGGVIGAGVDMANGSAYDYPTQIIVPMHKSSGTKHG